MPFFQYTATDKQGRPVQGTLQASSPQEAQTALAQGGYTVTGITGAGGATVAPPRPAAAAAAAPAPRPQPVAQRPIETPAPAKPQSLASPTSRPKGQPKKTKWGTDKDIYFIFNQLASYARSGSGVAVGAGNLGNTYQRADYKESLQVLARNSVEGSRVADTLELYPYLYPPHVVGMVRAGETGGYLPDAFEAVAGQAMNSIKFRRWFVYLGLAALMVIVCVPLMKALVDGAVTAWKTQEQSGGSASGTGALIGGVLQSLKWPVGPMMLVMILALYFGAHWWQSTPIRRWRHKLALSVPSTGKRAKAESLATFSWNMGMLSKVGLPPRQVWMLAAATMPNQEMRHRMEEEGQQMTDTTKLSEALGRTHLVPQEYAPMVQTGEITGDIPGQLLQASQATQSEFEVQDKFARGRVGCWILLLFVLGSAILFGMFYGDLYPRLFKEILGE